jgi:hypothetical protein
MPISNEQVVDSLIAFYKSRGADVSYLFNDPVFTHLPIQDKVESVKRHASQIHDGIPTTWNKEEKAGVIGGAIGGGLAGLGTGALAARAFQEGLKNAGKPIANIMAANKAAAASIAFATLVGTGIGAYSSYVNNKSKVDARLGLKDQLKNTIRDPSDQNAVGTLSIQEQVKREHLLRDALLNRVSERLTSGTNEYLEKRLPIQMQSDYSAFTS